MTKHILTILFLLMSVFQSLTAQDRPKIGVVLSGGGAKGAAHVQALKVIEEVGLPVDVIVGTSMGSIVGGLYAMGYNANQLDSIIRTQDWNSIIFNSKPRRQQHLYNRISSDRFLLSINFKHANELKKMGGLLSGESVDQLLSNLTVGFHDSIDFSKDLKIPFACVASDVVTGKEVDMHSGVLAKCMRASMSIPGVFAPIHKNGMVLVDGGLSNNFPVDVARQMGADYVIGVNVGDESLKEEELNSMASILSQIVDLACRKKLADNIQNTDIFIKVDITGYSAASFSKEAIDTLLYRGRQAALAKMDDMKALRTRIGADSITFIHNPLIVRSNKSKDKEIFKVEHKGSNINLGLRIDNEELASIIFGGEHEINKDLQLKSKIEIRLGQRSYGQVGLSMQPVKNWSVEGLYDFTYSNIDLYNFGDYVSNINYNQNRLRFQIYRSWSLLNIAAGVNYYKRNYIDILTTSHWVTASNNLRDDRHVNYFGIIQYDSRDSHIYAHTGTCFSAQYTHCTSDGTSYYGNDALSVSEGHLEVAIPFSSRFTLVPMVCGRFMSGAYAKFSDHNMIGGVNLFGHYFTQQMPFAGVNWVELVESNLAIGGLTARYRIGKNHHVFLVGNYGMMSNDIKHLNNKNYTGIAACYGYTSPFGPIEFNLNWSDRTKFGVYFNFGYTF